MPDGFDVFFRNMDGNYKRLHKGVFTSEKGAQSRLEQYKAYGEKKSPWTKDMIVKPANIR